MTTTDAKLTITKTTLIVAQWLVVHENFPYHVLSDTDNEGVGRHFVKDLARKKETEFVKTPVETADEAIAAVKRYLEQCTTE
mgnify:CR=1 FL=1